MTFIYTAKSVFHHEQYLSQTRSECGIPESEDSQPLLQKEWVKNHRIIIGEHTCYDDVDGADQFEKHVTHFYDFIGDKLIIGKLCAIARGIEFVMNGANHRMDGVTTYPFYIMGGDWGSVIAPEKDELPLKFQRCPVTQ